MFMTDKWLPSHGYAHVLLFLDETLRRCGEDFLRHCVHECDLRRRDAEDLRTELLRRTLDEWPMEPTAAFTEA